MVLPVPDRPKNSATSPGAWPTLALQCIGSTPSAGSFQFITPKIDFLISPAYSVPAMHDHPLREGERDRGAGAHAVDRRVGLEVGRVQDDVVRLEAGELGLRSGG